MLSGTPEQLDSQRSTEVPAVSTNEAPALQEIGCDQRKYWVVVRISDPTHLNPVPDNAAQAVSVTRTISCLPLYKCPNVRVELRNLTFSDQLDACLDGGKVPRSAIGV